MRIMERIDEPSPVQLSINDLPEEILEFIFSFLNIKERIKIERVCKYWQYIGTSFQIKELNTNIVSTDITDYMLMEILKRCGNSVLAIELENSCRTLTAQAVSIIGDHCPNLKSIQLDGIPAVDSEFIYFSIKCSKLKEAVLNSWKSNWCSSYGEDGMISFLQSCQELEILQIVNNHFITGLCFQFISPKVKNLKLINCRGLMPEGFLKLGKCKSIEHLEINTCRDLDTDSLQEILKQNCNSLKHLSLNELRYNDSMINYQALPFKLLTKLESISINENRYMKDDTLLQIAHNCKNLRTLDVSGTGLTDFGLKQLTSCPLLTTLNVSCVNKITDESIIPLAMVGKLESLTIRGNKNITDNACNTLSAHCTKLKYLDLSSCRKISDETVFSFRNAMKLRKDNQQKLKIVAGGTKIRVFIQAEELTITLFEDFCPEYRSPYLFYGTSDEDSSNDFDESDWDSDLTNNSDSDGIMYADEGLESVLDLQE